jgi:hypothetical protein
VDRHTVITGSFIFTRAAQERSAEDLVLARSPTLLCARTGTPMQRTLGRGNGSEDKFPAPGRRHGR